MSYCPQCGTETLQGASFCVKCGSRLPGETLQPSRASIPVEAPPISIPPVIVPPVVLPYQPVQIPSPAEVEPEATVEEPSFLQENSAVTPSAPFNLPPPPEPSAPLRKRPIWFVAHWRGELSLGVSYWGMGIILYVLILVLAFGAGSISTNLSSAYTLAGFWITFWGGTIALQFWLWVGVWRSANNHVSRGGRAGWATTAKVMVVLGCLQSFGQFTGPGGGLQNITDAVKHIDTIHGWSKYEVKPLRNGQEILIRGTIGEGIADAFEKIVLANPKARVVQIDSPGGLLVEAKRIREQIRTNGMSTFAPRECTSAATIIFMGGVERFMADKAKLGFHQPNVPTFDDETLRGMVAKEEDYMIASGVSREFMTRAFSHKGSDIWYPSQHELLAAGVVTGVTRGDEFGMTAIDGWKEKNKGELELLKLPLYQAMKEHEPEAYGKIVSAFNESMSTNASMNELRARTIPLITEVAMRRLPQASDGAVIAFGRVLVAQMEALLEISPDLCYGLIYPPNGVANRNVTQKLSQELLEQEQAVMAGVITTYDAKQLIPTEAVIEKDLEKAIRLLAGRQGAEAISVLSKLGNPKTRGTMDKRELCTTIIGFYKSILTLPEPKAARLIRYLISQAK